MLIIKLSRAARQKVLFVLAMRADDDIQTQLKSLCASAESPSKTPARCWQDSSIPDCQNPIVRRSILYHISEFYAGIFCQKRICPHSPRHKRKIPAQQNAFHKARKPVPSRRNKMYMLMKQHDSSAWNIVFHRFETKCSTV